MTNKQQRKYNANRMARLREDRDARGVCRVCEAPAVRSERTGLLTKACRRHLGCDVTRKMIYVLPVEDFVRPHRGPVRSELVLPLPWHEHL